MVEKQTAKKVTPPYATPAGLRLFLDKIKRVKPPQLTSKWMEDNELPFGDAIVNTMKFLGAVDKDGNLLPSFAPLRLEGKQSEEALASLMTNAYKPVFDQIDDIAAASDSDLSNAFKTAYDVGEPGRYVRPFLLLCHLAGLREAKATAEIKPRATRRQAPSTTSKATAGGATGQSKRSDKKVVGRDAGARGPVVVQVIVQLDVPWDAPIDEVRKRIRAVSNLESTEGS